MPPPPPCPPFETPGPFSPPVLQTSPAVHLLPFNPVPCFLQIEFALSGFLYAYLTAVVFTDMVADCRPLSLSRFRYLSHGGGLPPPYSLYISLPADGSRGAAVIALAVRLTRTSRPTTTGRRRSWRHRCRATPAACRCCSTMVPTLTNASRTMPTPELPR